MTRPPLFMLVFGLASCDEFKTEGDVEGSCGTDSYGYSSPSRAAKEGLERTNCYRNLMGLSRGTLDRELDDASQAHAEYMEDIGTITHQESSSVGGFTGEWVWDRMDSAGYDRVDGSSWSEVVAFGFDPGGAVDGWMGTVYHRIPFTMVEWSDLGFGQADLFASMSFVSPYPAGSNRAVIFPVDGQTDVPTSFNSDEEIPDPAPDHGVVGYPITVTVGADDVTGDSSVNPYSLELLDWVLIGPSGGEVEVLVADPTTDDHLNIMASMVPVDPLIEGEEYEAEMTVSWNGEERTLFALFTTASD